MKIGIIDSGIDINHKKLTTCKIEGVAIGINNNDELYVYDDYNDLIGHGTATAGIIHKHNPNAELFVVKIFDHQGIINEKSLHSGIELCIDKKTDIINVSLGVQTNTPHESLINLCEMAYSVGIVIVAAAHNDAFLECYPAGFSSVFGVVCGKVKGANYGYDSSSGFFISKGDLQRVLWKNNQFNITAGTSFACAHFAGIMSKIIESQSFNKDITLLKSFLIDGADKEIYPSSSFQSSDIKKVPYIQRDDLDQIGISVFTTQKNKWIKKIALFPSGEKEMNTFGEFPDLCPYDIIKSIDYPRNLKGNVGGIYSLKDDDWNNFDTLVLGYFQDHQFEANVKLGYEISQKAIEFNKNFFLFSPYLKKKLLQFISKTNYDGNMYMPEVDWNAYQQLKQFKHLPDVSIPVIAVIGTSNKQGKFTTQLRVKNILEKEGYKVSQISTEPHGELFGASYSFPYGHQGTVELLRGNWLEFLRTLVKCIQYYNKPNIIITGTQGCFIPRTYEHVGNVTTSLDYIFGIQPDGFICAINPQDTMEQITDVLDTMRIFTKALPLFCVLTPYEKKFQINNTNIFTTEKKLSQEEYMEKLVSLKNQLGLEVFDIWDFNNDINILKIIENAY